jgi:hypothetical protein
VRSFDSAALRSGFRLRTPASPFDKLKARSRPQFGSSSNLPVQTNSSSLLKTACFAIRSAADREHPKVIAQKRSGCAQIKACEGRGREILRLRCASLRISPADSRFALRQAQGSLTPAIRLKFKSARQDHSLFCGNIIHSTEIHRRFRELPDREHPKG